MRHFSLYEGYLAGINSTVAFENLVFLSLTLCFLIALACNWAVEIKSAAATSFKLLKTGMLFFFAQASLFVLFAVFTWTFAAAPGFNEISNLALLIAGPVMMVVGILFLFSSYKILVKKQSASGTRANWTYACFILFSGSIVGLFFTLPVNPVFSQLLFNVHKNIATVGPVVAYAGGMLTVWLLVLAVVSLLVKVTLKTTRYIAIVEGVTGLALLCFGLFKAPVFLNFVL